MHKPRKRLTEADAELQRRLVAARAAGQFQSYELAIEDLQDIEILERRRNLSKGELAAIAFAKKTRQAFLTDDQGARSLAASAMDRTLVQTTPHLLGWLVFIGQLGDGDVNGIVQEHESWGRPLRKHFVEMYEEGLRCRLLAAGQ